MIKVKRSKAAGSDAGIQTQRRSTMAESKISSKKDQKKKLVFGLVGKKLAWLNSETHLL